MSLASRLATALPVSTPAKSEIQELAAKEVAAVQRSEDEEFGLTGKFARLPEISSIPPVSALWKVVGWAIPAIIIGSCI